MGQDEEKKHKIDGCFPCDTLMLHNLMGIKKYVRVRKINHSHTVKTDHVVGASARCAALCPLFLHNVADHGGLYALISVPRFVLLKIDLLKFWPWPSFVS